MDIADLSTCAGDLRISKVIIIFLTWIVHYRNYTRKRSDLIRVTMRIFLFSWDLFLNWRPKGIYLFESYYLVFRIIYLFWCLFEDWVHDYFLFICNWLSLFWIMFHPETLLVGEPTSWSFTKLNNTINAVYYKTILTRLFYTETLEYQNHYRTANVILTGIRWKLICSRWFLSVISTLPKILFF